jgi:hypothetical protein
MDGRKAWSEKQRSDAISRYYESPNMCLHCGSVIEVGSDRKVQSVRRKTFCNHSCAASHLNPIRKIATSMACSKCGSDMGDGGTEKTLCNECLTRTRMENANRSFGHSQETHVSKRTKGDLIGSRNGYQSAKSDIGKHARKVYRNSGKEYKCAECQYDAHVDVCHIRPVTDFPDDATIEQINSIDNLVALCPNHHWELDHGILSL